jgi:hypothetical protein
MIAVRIGPDMRMAIVGAPSYFAKRSPPRTRHELTEHYCINLRLPIRGLYPWDLEKGKRKLKVQVDGQLIFNSTYKMLNATMAGLGWHTRRRAWRNPISPRVILGRYSRIGARLPRATTSTTRIAAKSLLALLVEALRYRG